MTRFTHRALTASVLTCIASSTTLLAQPTLFPPGPPTGPSGRMGVRTQITMLPYVITVPGSYYISQTLTQTIAGSPGILVDANEVTIDLGGFTLYGLGTPGDHGITSGPGAVRDVTIHNGFVAFWGGSGIMLPTVNNVHIWEVTAFDNDAEGIAIGASGILRHVIATNQILGGIRCERWCKLTNCVATSNFGPGIITGPYCHVSDSVAGFNSADGFALAPNNTVIASTACNNGMNGMTMPMSTKVTDCVASENGFGAGFGSGFNCFGDGNSLQGCTAFNNFDSGYNSIIAPPFGGNSAQECVAQSNGFASGIGDGFTNYKTILQCQANGNFDNGIEVFSSSKVMNNNCNGNGANGIEALGDGNAIEENHVVGNGIFGISTLPNPGPPGNLATRNRAHMNGAGAFAFIAGVDTTGAVMVGPIILGAIGAHMANIAY
ncbi:MAG: hypothetical protein AABZ08_02250 [Planctomycetota bacterium]